MSQRQTEQILYLYSMLLERVECRCTDCSTMRALQHEAELECTHTHMKLEEGECGQIAHDIDLLCDEVHEQFLSITANSTQ